jgi:cytidyltransferase-like protein
MKIGVFGGTFNPPHKGHVRLANAAADMLGLDIADCVIFEDVPTAVKTAKTTGARVVSMHDKRWMAFEEEMRKVADKYIYSFDEME